MTDKVSALMSVYADERPDRLEAALDSLLAQTEPPDEIVLVEDGPLGAALAETVKRYARHRPDLFVTVPLRSNVGLGLALRAGVDRCRHGLVARMDSDDIARPDRLARQKVFLRNNPDVSAVGSWIAEFADDPVYPLAVRRVPMDHAAILAFSRFRNPMNHMTVLFRREHVLRAGNYRHHPRFEDYHLWVRMLRSGARLANIPEPLVSARAGAGLHRRRRGWAYARDEARFQASMLRLGHIPAWRFFANLALRGLPRLMPDGAMGWVYKAARARPAGPRP